MRDDGRGHGEGPRIRHYARSAAGFWRSAVNDHVVAAAGLRPGDVVLDIGAGLGPAAMPAVRKGASVVAVDPSRIMRTGLQIRRLWQRGRRRIRVIAGTAEHLPLDAATVDVAWAVNAMHHWTDLAAAAQELSRVMRPGGRVILVDEDFDDPSHMMAHPASSHHDTYPMIDPDVVAATFVDAGFTATGVRLLAGGSPVLQVTAELAAKDR